MNATGFVICFFILPGTQPTNDNRYLLIEREGIGFFGVLIFSTGRFQNLTREISLVKMEVMFELCHLSCHSHATNGNY